MHVKYHSKNNSGELLPKQHHKNTICNWFMRFLILFLKNCLVETQTRFRKSHKYPIKMQAVRDNQVESISK